MERVIWSSDLLAQEWSLRVALVFMRNATVHGSPKKARPGPSARLARYCSRQKSWCSRVAARWPGLRAFMGPDVRRYSVNSWPDRRPFIWKTIGLLIKRIGTTSALHFFF